MPSAASLWPRSSRALSAWVYEATFWRKCQPWGRQRAPLHQALKAVLAGPVRLQICRPYPSVGKLATTTTVKPKQRAGWCRKRAGLGRHGQNE